MHQDLPLCNSSKGAKRLYEWKGLQEKDAIPRIAEGKYLKLLYDLHEQRGTLNVDKNELGRRMCPDCDLRERCEEERTVEKLSVYVWKGGFTERRDGLLHLCLVTDFSLRKDLHINRRCNRTPSRSHSHGYSCR